VADDGIGCGDGLFISFEGGVSFKHGMNLFPSHCTGLEGGIHDCRASLRVHLQLPSHADNIQKLWAGVDGWRCVGKDTLFACCSAIEHLAEFANSPPRQLHVFDNLEGMGRTEVD